MEKVLLIIIFIFGMNEGYAQKMPIKRDVIACMEKVNNSFVERHPNAGDSIRNGTTQPSNIWTRGVYFEGLMAMHGIAPRPQYMEYALQWAEANRWDFHGGSHTLKADNQCCAQTYIDLYRLGGQPQALDKVERLLNNVVNNTTHNDWNDVDAIQMAMPVYARMGALKKDLRYFDKMMELYRHVRDHIGLYNPVDKLWWQSAKYMPPYKEPNGKNCYWSRGNGWALAGLARTIEEIDGALTGFDGEELLRLQRIRESLSEDFIEMAIALKACQRKDGFWNCSLSDSLHFEGPEASSTSLFIYGMAWGVRKQLLSSDAFTPVILKGWEGLVQKAIRPDGLIGYVQGTGKEPKDGQPTGYDRQPDYDDFGTGCFLLAGSELFRLLPK